MTLMSRNGFCYRTPAREKYIIVPPLLAFYSRYYIVDGWHLANYVCKAGFIWLDYFASRKLFERMQQECVTVLVNDLNLVLKFFGCISDLNTILTFSYQIRMRTNINNNAFGCIET
jgi:hypothetical protein